jgi:septum formation protein
MSHVVSTRVHFAHMTDHEIAGYVATGEPLNVAGGFTLDGLSAPFFAGIEGVYSLVIVLSLALLRNAINSLGYEWFELIS